MNAIFSLIILMFLFWIGFMITGALLKALLWMFLALPVALFLWACGLTFCCTLILIPVGLRLIFAGCKVLMFV